MKKKQTTARRANPDHNDAGNMALSGHLKELRNRLIVVVVFFIAANLFFLSNAQQITDLLTQMGKDCGYEYVFIAPQELLVQYFKVALLAGTCVSVPLIMYQCWAFASPGLTKKESRGMALALFFGLICFVIGVAFAYKITLPFMLNFLIKLGNGTAYTASISVESYLSFVLLVFIIFGVIFEMPLLSVILSRIGIVTPTLLKKARPAAIIIIFIIAALITPPDIFSQIMVAIPMVLLYEVSIALSYVFKKKHDDAQADEDDDEEDSPDQSAKK